MHELSIACGLIDQILDVAQVNGMKMVDEVELQTGILRQIIPEVMQEAYKQVTKDTIAGGSVLVITQIEANAKCRRCASEFEPQIDNYLCPDCLVADVEVLQGNHIILKSVSGGNKN